MVLLQTLEKDSSQQKTEGFPANVWVVGNNEKGAMWLAEKNGVEKTKAEAQALVTAEVTAAQAAWDASSDEAKAMTDRPTDITLP
jgi:hypothetical protein